MLQLVLTILGFQIVLLLALRPLILWYFKISPAVRALESIAESLEQMPAAREHRARMNQSVRRVG